MRKYLLTTFLASAIPIQGIAEIVELTDGRMVDLRGDGTFAFVEPSIPEQEAFFDLGEHYFALDRGEYGQNRVRFMPIVTNVTEKGIVGFKFTARFLDPFGDEIFGFTGQSDEPLQAGETSTSDLFYYFEDNQFISGEPYDKLLPMVTNQSGEIEVLIDAIALEGGEIILISE